MLPNKEQEVGRVWLEAGKKGENELRGARAGGG